MPTPRPNLSEQEKANVTRLLAEIADPNRILRTPTAPTASNPNPKTKILSRRSRRTILKNITAPDVPEWGSRRDRREAANHPNRYRKALNDAIPKREQFLVRKIRTALTKTTLSEIPEGHSA